MNLRAASPAAQAETKPMNTLSPERYDRVVAAQRKESSVMYLRRRPHPSLAGHVDYYWSVSAAPATARVQIVPSGTLDVVVNLHDDEIRICDRDDPARLAHYSGAVISGAQSRYFVVDMRAHAAIVGVHFTPGGAF